MRKMVLILVGAVLIAGSTSQIAFSQIAFSKERYVRHARQFTSEQFRNSNAAVPAPPSAVNRMGGWASMTGFN
jgi:hypothetical protein